MIDLMRAALRILNEAIESAVANPLPTTEEEIAQLACPVCLEMTDPNDPCCPPAAHPPIAPLYDEWPDCGTDGAIS